MAHAYTTSRGIKKDRLIRAALGMPVYRKLSKAKEGDIIVGWGEKDNTRRAKAFADQQKLPYVRLEDGFLGYLSHPELDRRRVSLITDHTGIYYNASTASDLEQYLNDTDWADAQIIARAERAIERIKRWKLSKYNHAPNDISADTSVLITSARGQGQDIILLIDQTFGDKGITMGMASADSFEAMFKAAIENHPNAVFLIKTHPDVLLGKKKGYLTPSLVKKLTKTSGKTVAVHWIADMVAPLSLIEAVDHVYTVTSQMGFEALIAGKPVSCFGMPFYAGWGLTQDAQTCDRRQNAVTLAVLVAAALIKYTRYVCPYTKEQTELEQILDYLVAEKQMPRLKAKRIIAVDFSLWKRGFVDAFIQGTQRNIIWLSRRRFRDFSYQEGDAVLVWGRKFEKQEEAIPNFVDLWRMEDGFLRSIGLGSDLRRPASLVLEKTGMYYDATRPSAVENFLKNHDFSQEDRRRGEAFIATMQMSKLSKYNVGRALTAQIDTQGRSIALVTGQVEGDASIALGTKDIKTNAALLQAVKAERPDDFIIYKPHPDVLSGNRKGIVPEDVLDACADTVFADVDIQDCLKLADSVHVMTSGAGLEALVMDKEVYCYGLPFYAGWGVTTDRLRCDRRGRQLTRAELIYAAYIVYPSYVSWPSGSSSCAETLIEDIKKARRREKSVEVHNIWSRLRSYSRKGLYLLEALLK